MDMEWFFNLFLIDGNVSLDGRNYKCDLIVN